MRTKLTTTAMLLSLGLGSLAFGQQTTEPKADEPRATAERREQRIENRDDRQDNRQDNRQDARGDRRENRDVRQEDRQADDAKRQENRQARREQLRERLANQPEGRRPIDTMFTLIDRIVDTASGADVANASLPQVQETYALLRQFDRDNNGTITHEELVAGQAAAHQQRTASAIARLDTNKDGKLSQEEATAGKFTGTFEQLDKNKDGFLDRDEVTASYMAMRERLGLRRDGDAAAPATTTRTTTTPEQPKD